MKNYLAKMNDIYYIEQFKFMGEEGEETFKRKWQGWVNYKLSQSYLAQMI